MKVVLAACVVLSCGLMSGAFADDNSLFEIEQFGIAHLNGASWRKYDTLIKESSVVREDVVGVDKSSVPAKSLDRSIRLAIDWDVKKVFFLSRAESVGQPKERLDLELIAKTQGLSRWVRYPGRNRRIESEEIPITLMKPNIMVPDIRFVGMQPFPSWFNSDFETQVNTAQAIPSGNNVRVTRTNDTIQVATDGGDSTFVRLYDVKSLMLKQMYTRLAQDGRILFEQDIKWIEKDGVFLPVEIIAEKYSFKDKSTKFTTVSIFWRSINEPLDPSLFEPKVLDDFKKVQDFINEDTFKAGGCLNSD